MCDNEIVLRQPDVEIPSDVSDDENLDLSTRADRPVFKPVLTPHFGFLQD